MFLSNIAHQNNIHLDQFSQKRLELLSFSKVIACGVISWDSRYDRYTTQIQQGEVIRFPDNSELYLTLQTDLDTFEFQASDPPDKALYAYTIGEDGELHFSVFSQPKRVKVSAKTS